MKSYKDILNKRQRMVNEKPVWPLQTQEWPSRRERKQELPL